MDSLPDAWPPELPRADSPPAGAPRPDRRARGGGGGAGPAARSHVVELLARLREHRPRKARYQLVRTIARGGMGVVSEVWDQDLRRHLALKSLRRDRSFEGLDSFQSEILRERFLVRFLEEAQVTGQLGHPGVVPLHELGLGDDGEPYFTMPLVPGRTLAEIVADYHEAAAEGHDGGSEWTLGRILGALLKVCEAVAYAHDKGVIHRDLKPDNVMVGRFGEVYVMDWGVARVLGREDVHDLRLRRGRAGPDSGSVHTDRSDAPAELGDSPLLTMDGDVVGTPAYMPPEQAEGRVDELGQRSDVYALGALLYAVLTGRDPYAPDRGRRPARDVLARLLAGPPETVRALSPAAPADLVAVCEKAMARDAQHRYPSVLSLAADLLAFLEQRPVPARVARDRARGLGARAASRVHRAQLWVARHRKVASTVLAAASVLAVATLFYARELSGAYADERRARAESVQRGDALGIRALLAREEEDELWPATPARAPALEGWLAEARAILARAGASPEGPSASTAGALAPSSAKDPGDDARLRRRGAAEARVLAELVPRVEERLARARALRRRTIDDAAEDWRRCAEDVARREAYGGLRIEPQLGLVPLRRDPGSGLWEFWHVPSGERPTLDGDRWRVRPETGIVLVLVPGGTFEMGSPEGEPFRLVQEARHAETVAPFFVGKYEVTQAQWERVVGTAPSYWQPGRQNEPIDPTHPVEWIGWNDAARFARRSGLALPGEVQWEYAARGGTGTAFWTGDDPATLEARENLDDRSNRASTSGKLPWDDGYYAHSAVGTFAPSPFGLFDVHGNVSEWVADTYWVYPGDSVTDPLREDDPRTRLRMFRGGSYMTSASASRSAKRRFDHPDAVFYARGLRVARPLDG